MKGWRMEDWEVLEAIKARVEFTRAQVIADAIAQAEEEMQGVKAEEEMQGAKKVVLTFAEKAGIALEEAIGAILKALGAGGEIPELEEEKGEPLNFPTARDRKEARQKRRAVERATVSHFRQYRARETAWTMQKRTGPRHREWRGPWKEN